MTDNATNTEQSHVAADCPNERVVSFPCNGQIALNGWSGIYFQDVRIIGETPKKYKIKALSKTKLAGRGRYLERGETTLVPKYAVKFTEN